MRKESREPMAIALPLNCSTALPSCPQDTLPGGHFRTFPDIRLPETGEALGDEWLRAWAAVGRFFMPRVAFFRGHNGPRFTCFGHEIPFFPGIIRCMLEGKPRYWVKKRVYGVENGLGRTVVLHSVAIIAERTGGNTRNWTGEAGLFLRRRRWKRSATAGRRRSRTNALA